MVVVVMVVVVLVVVGCVCVCDVYWEYVELVRGHQGAGWKGPSRYWFLRSQAAIFGQPVLTPTPMVNDSS